MSAFCECHNHFSDILSHSPCGLSSLIEDHFFSDPGHDPDDNLLFSRIELLHLLLDARFVNDEEDTLLSSILHNRRENISLVQHQSKFSSQQELFLGEEPAGSLLCGFAFAFDRHAKSFAFSLNAYSSS